MTKLNRPVVRKVNKLVIGLEPNEGNDPLVTVREAGRRTKQSITVSGLYTLLCMRAAEVARSKRKRQRRGGLLRREQG